MNKNNLAIATILFLIILFECKCIDNNNVAYSYFEDYAEGLAYSKKHNTIILLIFHAYSLPHHKFSDYIETEEVKKILNKNTIILLLVDDKAFYHNVTKGEFNKLLQNKFNSPFVPSVLIIDNKENIIVPPHGYLTYDEFVLFLKKTF